ncbi:hypothetical protein K438DRAFT_1764547 [Mycena galopus ATCC 62051]|nr:hypothetical protein K438DRAFT_1764547 [Mycena galopus ATCC 62051]
MPMSYSTYPPATPVATPVRASEERWGPPDNSAYQLPPISSDSNRWGPPSSGFQSTPSPPLGSEGSENIDHFGMSSTPSPPFSFSPSPIIKPMFVDTLARDMNLEETQRQNLHDFVACSNSRPFQLGSAGKGLSQADLGGYRTADTATHLLNPTHVRQKLGLPPVTVATVPRHPWHGCRARSVGNFPG